MLNKFLAWEKEVGSHAIFAGLAIVVLGCTSLLVILLINMGVDLRQCISPHTVISGETLSGIAMEHKPEGLSLDEYIVDLQQANNLATDQVHADQVLTLPPGSNC